MFVIHPKTSDCLRAFAREGDFFTWLSVLVMGSGCFRFRRIGKGLIYLLTQAAYWLYLDRFGLKYIRHLGTLGENTQLKIWDEALQIYRRVPGDNSLLILLFSILTILLSVLYVYVWFLNVRETGQLCILHRAGKPMETLADEARSLLDSRFHVTLLAAPMVTLLLFTVLPILFMMLLAFTNFDSAHQPPGALFTWTGMKNVTDIFLGNPVKSHTFFSILGWTLIWAVLATFTNYILGMALAMLINHKLVKLKKMWRTLFIISIAIPQFVSLLLISRSLEWAGAVNVLLMKLNIIRSPLPFLTDPNFARVCVVVVNMWVGIPYSMLTFSGVLMNIPAELYESAEIDGAGPVRRFFSITLPYMMFVTAPATITSFVSNINNFNVIYLLTGGGPFSLDYYQAGKTDLLVTWLYKLTVDQHEYSLASTIGIFIFIIVSTSSLLVYNRTAAVQKEDMFQ